jgi:hypothetical protein
MRILSLFYQSRGKDTGHLGQEVSISTIPTRQFDPLSL